LPVDPAGLKAARAEVEQLAAQAEEERKQREALLQEVYGPGGKFDQLQAAAAAQKKIKADKRKIQRDKAAAWAKATLKRLAVKKADAAFLQKAIKKKEPPKPQQKTTPKKKKPRKKKPKRQQPSRASERQEQRRIEKKEESETKKKKSAWHAKEAERVAAFGASRGLQGRAAWKAYSAWKKEEKEEKKGGPVRKKIRKTKKPKKQ
jgi:hypothetical protein